MHNTKSTHNKSIDVLKSVVQIWVWVNTYLFDSLHREKSNLKAAAWTPS